MKMNLIVFVVLLAGNCSGCNEFRQLMLSSAPSADPPRLSRQPDIEPKQLLERSLAIAATAENPDYVFSQIAISLAQAEQYKQALNITTTIRDAATKTQTLSNLAATLAEAKQDEQALAVAYQALEVASNMEETDLQSYALSQIASIFAQLGKSEQSANTLRAVFHLTKAAISQERTISEPQVMHLVDIAERALEAQHPAIALQILESAIAFSEQLAAANRPPQNIAELGSLLIALEQFDQALGVARAIAPPIPRVRILSEVAVKLASLNQAGRANQLLAEATELAHSLSGGYLTNGSCYIEKSHALEIVVAALTTVQRMQTAAELAKDIRDCVPANASYTIRSNTQGDAYVDIIRSIPDVDTANAVMQVFQANNSEFASNSSQSDRDALTHSRALAAIAIKLAELGEIEQSIQIAETVQSAFIQSAFIQSTFTEAIEWTPHESMLALITELLKHNAFAEATEIAENLQSFEPKSIQQEITAFIAIGKSLKASGQLERAEEIFHNAFEKAQTLHGEGQTTASLDLSFQADILIETGDLFKQAGQLEQANQLFDQAFEHAIQIFAGLREDDLPNDTASVDAAMNKVSSVLRISNSLAQRDQNKQAQMLFTEAFNIVRNSFEDDNTPFERLLDRVADSSELRSIVVSRLRVTTEFAMVNQSQLAAHLAQDLLFKLQHELYYSDSLIEKMTYELTSQLADSGHFSVALALAEIPFSPATQAQMMTNIAIVIQKAESLSHP